MENLPPQSSFQPAQSYPILQQQPIQTVVDQDKNHHYIWWITLIIFIIVLLAVLSYFLWKRHSTQASSSALLSPASASASTSASTSSTSSVAASTTNASVSTSSSSAAAAVAPVQISTQVSNQSVYLGLNSSTAGDYAVLQPLASPVSSAQQWTIQTATVGSISASQIINLQSGGYLAVNGGLGSVVVADKSFATSTATLFNISGGLIIPADPIYGPPTESIQLVLAQTDPSQSQSIASAIQDAVSASTDSAAQSAALQAYSGQTSPNLSGTTCTLSQQSSSAAAQMWLVK